VAGNGVLPVRKVGVARTNGVGDGAPAVTGGEAQADNRISISRTGELYFLFIDLSSAIIIN
jgi:hypothetical protein